MRRRKALNTPWKFDYTRWEFEDWQVFVSFPKKDLRIEHFLSVLPLFRKVTIEAPEGINLSDESWIEQLPMDQFTEFRKVLMKGAIAFSEEGFRQLTQQKRAGGLGGG